MTRKSKSRKRKFGSTTNDTKDVSREIDKKVKEYCDKDIDCNEVDSEKMKIHKTYGREVSNAQQSQLHACHLEKTEGCKREDTKPEVLLLTDEKDHLEELQKDFPPSKESSISFPSIDNVNKKLSDLFDYIGKHTMDESEEKEELEERKVEAEIEKAKAETYRAIRESERKFGSGTEGKVQLRSDMEYSTDYDDDDDDFQVKNKKTFKTNDDYENKYSNVKDLEWDTKDLEAILNDESKDLKEKFTIQDLEQISDNIEGKYSEDDDLQSRIKQYIKQQKKGNKIENVFLYTIYTNLELLKSDEKKTEDLIQDNNEYMLSNKGVKTRVSKDIDRIKEQLRLSEDEINTYIGNISDILKPNIEQIDQFELIITERSKTLNEKREGTDFEKYTYNNIDQCCKGDDDEKQKRELLKKLKSYDKITQEEEKRKLLYELLEIDNLGNTFSDKINEISLGKLKQIFGITSGQIINLIKENITNDTDYNVVLEKINEVLRNKFEEIKKSKTERIKEREKKIETINDNISSAEKDLEQLEKDLITIKEKIKENNERIQEATTQANIYKNQKEIIKKYKEFYGLEEEATLEEIKKAMTKKYKTIIDDVETKLNVISKKFKALWGGEQLDETIKNKCSDKFKNLIDNKVNFESFNEKNFIDFHEQVFGIYLEYYPVKNVINLATYGSGWGKEQEEVAKENLKKIKIEGTQLGDLIQTVKRDENNGSYGPFYKVLHTSSKIPKELYYNIEEDFNRLTKSDSDIDHIIYAGYGFSGSGKTYTLVEKDNPNSILNQIEKMLKKKKITPEIKTYSRYAEIYDRYCNNAIDDDYPDKKNLIKIPEEFVPYKEGSTISDYIENINKKRKQTTIGENDADKQNLFRTSIRKTPNNVESSRSHLFIDIILNVKNKDKIITLLDMAGNEDASVIQKDYFESFPGYKVEYDQLGTKIKTLTDRIKKVVSTPAGMMWKDWKGDTKSGYKPLVKAYHDLAKGGIIKTGYIRNIIKQEGQSYKINIKKWEELFDDIAGEDGPGESSLPLKSERDNFIKNYNYYQMLEIVLVIKKIYEALKSLEDGNEKIIKFCNQEKWKTKKTVTCASQTTDKNTKCYNFYKFKNGDFKKSINNFFKEILNKDSEISNFNKIENFYDADNAGLCGANSKTNAANALHKPFLSAIYNLYLQINNLVEKGEKEASRGRNLQKIKVIKHIKHYEEEYERYKEEKDTTEFWNNIEGYVSTKKEWDKKIIGKYHCPLRFQGNAINNSIDNLKKNLQEINNTKDTTYTSGTFPFDVWEEQKHHSGKYARKNYVIFTNVRLDLSHSVSIGKAYDISLKFSEELISDTKRSFGKKKVSKKTSTRSFRKRRRRRGPSETEIL